MKAVKKEEKMKIKRFFAMLLQIIMILGVAVSHTYADSESSGLSTATPIKLNETVEGCINHTSINDYYSFTTLAGSYIYSLFGENDSGNNNAAIRFHVLNSRNAEIGTAVVAYSTESRYFKLEPSTQYYVKVVVNHDSTLVGEIPVVRPYSFKITPQSEEPNSIQMIEEDISLGEEYRGNINNVQMLDDDYYRFHTESNTKFRLYFKCVDFGGIIYCDLLDKDGAQKKRISINAEGYSEEETIELEKNTVYYIRVHSYSNYTSMRSNGDYIFSVTEITPIYNVHFVFDNGDEMSSVNVKEGEKISKPNDPIKEGFNFDGWFFQDKKWDFDKDVVAGDMTLTAKFTEIIRVKSVMLPENEKVSIGKEITLSPQILPSNATDRTVTWKSSEPEIASVNARGVVTGVKEGYADITVTTNDGGKTATCRVKVTENGNQPIIPPEVEEITLEADESDRTLDILPGEIRRLSVSKEGRYIYGIKWKLAYASPQGCVSIKNGVITAKKAGTAKVTASYGTSVVEFYITVDGTVPESKTIIDGKKTYKLTAPKTVNVKVGEKKNVSIGIPVNMRKDDTDISVDVASVSPVSALGSTSKGVGEDGNADGESIDKVLDFASVGAGYANDKKIGIASTAVNENRLMPTGGDYSIIRDPQVGEKATTWDCIWFGNYWQEDTNGDGYCFSKDTTVTEYEPDGYHTYKYYADQDGNELYEFEGEAKTYLADKKQPVKWRVLNIDKNGNALLLADKLIDIVEPNETYADVTWETCTMRSYLNGYDGKQNVAKYDFTGDNSFIYNAFSESERNKIITYDLTNPDNPVYGETKGGNDTQDKIFCLSLEEAMTAGYGFVKNEFTSPSDADTQYCTDDDPTRVAVTTKFTDDKPGYYAEDAGVSDWWWLRSLGNDSHYFSHVSDSGYVDAYGGSYGDMDDDIGCIRPALCINLSSSSSLWSYAGTVCSDGTIQEPEAKKAVTGVSLQKSAKVSVGKTITLIPEVIPSDATDKTVIWSTPVISDPIATVDANGVVKGIKSGTVVITVTTKDGDYTASCTVTVEPVSSETDHEIKKPVVNSDGVTTWDSIWFGNYWQDTDSNGDGKVTKDDIKNPIKWRVLDVDNNGEALLLSDKILDISVYNEKFEGVTWEGSTMRSYLNSYGAGKNACGKDYSTGGFLNEAFSDDEKNAISTSALVNKDNPFYDTDGGNNTSDKIFFLSLDEVTTQGYGFVKNSITDTIYGEKLYGSDKDINRVAYTSQYADDKWGYIGNEEPIAAHWWLRTPGDKDGSCEDTTCYASYVGDKGEVFAFHSYFEGAKMGIRPAFRMNLSSAESLWSYAGTVESGKEGSKETIPVKGVSISAQESIKVGGTVTLIPVISPSNATNQGVTWKSSSLSTATVSTGGVVTGIKAGTAVITVTTNDGGYEASCTVTVTNNADAEVRVTGVELYPSQKTIAAGKTTKLNPIIKPSNATNQKVTWKSSVLSVALISADGTVTGIKAGTTRVTVTTDDGGFEAYCDITVKETVSNLTTENLKIKWLDYNNYDRTKATKGFFEIEALDVGTTYVVWTMTDENGKEVSAVTKVIVKKPITELHIAEKESSPLTLNIGEGKRLTVTGTKGNTDSKDLSFSVKGKGVKVSKSGYVVATTPGSEATVTVKAGKVSDSIRISVPSAEKYLSLNKTSANIKIPKPAATKNSTVALKLTTPKKKEDQPNVTWSIAGDPEGITVFNGVVSVGSYANPGCYVVKASADGYNTACCELIVR